MPDRPVFYFSRILTGYRIPILERLNNRLGGRLVSISGQAASASALDYLVEQGETGFRRVKVRNRWLRGDKIHAQPFKEAFSQFGDPSVILCEESPRSVTLPFLLRHARHHGSGRLLWGHFSSLDRRFDPEKNLFDRYRLELARRVEGCVCYTDGVADQLRPYLPDEKLFVARNTINLDPLLSQHDALATEERSSVRKRLGLPVDHPVIVFVGRLVPQKGTLLLVETFSKIRRDTDASLLVIGKGPDQVAMEEYVSRNQVDGVRFLGPLSDDDAAPYLFASDVMLMPGYLGLVINQAFAFGLPVVSRRNPIGVRYHSPEVEYVQNGTNGVLSEGEDADSLAEAVRSVISDRARFSANALEYARKNLTVDKMVDGLEAAIQYAEANQLRRPL